MGGQRGHVDSKPAREIFQTSSSLSFSSLSSSCASSWDDTIEINTKSSNEEQKGKLSKASSRGSEMSDVTHVRMQPATSPPLRPVKLIMNKGLECYDPERIPASVFGKTGDLNWSEISNESLFSLRISNCQAFCQSNVTPGECLSYSPSPLVKPEDAEEKRSEAKETKSGVTSRNDGEKSSSAPPVVSWNTSPSSFYQLYQAPPKKTQSFSTSVGEKKRKKTRKSKKTKTKTKTKKVEEKKKNKCCIWSWLCSGISKCECYKWRKCGCCCRG